MAFQGRFWPRRARFARARRPKKVELSIRGIYEPVESEEDVLGAVHDFLWRAGIPVFRQRERVPYCWNCHTKVSTPSEAGHPDLHGYVPVRSAVRWAKDDATRERMRTHLQHPIPFYIEMKRPKGGRHRPAQTLFVARAVDDGVVALFARGVAEVSAAFEKIGILLPPT